MLRRTTRNELSRTGRRGAISTEYVIILVLIAVGGILAFMVFGSQIQKQIGLSTDKLSGKTATATAVDQNDTTNATKQRDMSQDQSGQSDEITVGGGGGGP